MLIKYEIESNFDNFIYNDGSRLNPKHFYENTQFLKRTCFNTAMIRIVNGNFAVVFRRVQKSFRLDTIVLDCTLAITLVNFFKFVQ